MSTQVANTRDAAPLSVAGYIEVRGANGDIGQDVDSGMAKVFAAVRTSAGHDPSTSSELHLSDALKLLSLWLPGATPSSDSPSSVAVPDTIAQDSRRRMTFRLGVSAARAGATASCNDRVISTWNDMQTMRRNDDIRKGGYDHCVAEVADIARQMFRIDELTRIVRKKEKALKQLRLTRPDLRGVDSIEVYLAYVVRLRTSLELTVIAPSMEFYRFAEVTDEEPEAARVAVLAYSSR